MHLKDSFTNHVFEAGCDEAGRGCLAGPVFAAVVIPGANFYVPGLNDSKLLTRVQRTVLRKYIEDQAVAWAVACVDHQTIDRINILQASFQAMHEAIRKLKYAPSFLLIDGNRFRPFPGILHQCIVKGDAKFISIAAASILAKTHRDEFMERIHKEFPHYGWDRNKAYPTAKHINAIREYGYSEYHRKSFEIKDLRIRTGNPEIKTGQQSIWVDESM